MFLVGLYKTPCTCVSEIYNTPGGRSFKSSQEYETEAWYNKKPLSSKGQMAEWFYHQYPLTSETRSKEKSQRRTCYQFLWAHPP